MRSSILAVAAVSAVALAAPSSDIAAIKKSILKRQSLTAPGTGDAVILNFALTLEHLENAFYAQALARYTAADFTAAGYPNIYASLQGIARDEADHVAFLTGALRAAGATPVQACNYTFPYMNIPGFLGLSQVLEGVGVSAYLGAAGAINTTAFVTAAAAILTVEARHNAFIRYINGYTPAPQSYDTPQSATAVVTMATPFFVSCPTGSAPTIRPFPSLNLTTAAPARGSMINIAPTNASAVALTGNVFCGFASALGAGFSPYMNGSCMVPTANISAGQTYVVLSSSQSISDATVLAGPAIFELERKGGNPFASNSSSAATGGNSTTAPRSGAATLSVGGLSVLAGVFAFLF